ncbi:MAG TPA: polysaccharide deacetylase family protein [Gemmatimonadaceae bacterium]|nr:polysaccharide deacetylase family protein [Gemmatimonadaceae bacterium]
MTRVLVSIHDVAPALAPAVVRLWDMCAEHGVRPALLVVPDWHGSWPLERDEPFLAWLHARAADGAEVLLHGLRHDEHGLPRRWRDSVRALGRTAREGEFLTLDRAAAGARIREGLARLRALELRPVGFVPPAWLARSACWRAVADAGLPLAEDDAAVYLVRPHRAPTRLPAPVVRWSARGSARAWASAGVAEWRWRAQRAVPLVRVALHPSDLSHPATARSAARAIARWASAGQVVSYESIRSLHADP